MARPGARRALWNSMKWSSVFRDLASRNKARGCTTQSAAPVPVPVACAFRLLQICMPVPPLAIVQLGPEERGSRPRVNRASDLEKKFPGGSERLVDAPSLPPPVCCRRGVLLASHIQTGSCLGSRGLLSTPSRCWRGGGGGGARVPRGSVNSISAR